MIWDITTDSFVISGWSIRFDFNRKQVVLINGGSDRRGLAFGRSLCAYIACGLMFSDGLRPSGLTEQRNHHMAPGNKKS